METNKLTGIDEAVNEIRSLGRSTVITAYPGTGTHEVFYCPSEATLRNVIVKHCIGRDMQVHQSEAFIRCCHFLSMEVASLKQRIRNQAETIQKYQSNPEHNGEQLSLEERHANQMKTIFILQGQLQVLKQACQPILKWSDERPSIVKNIVAACKQIQ